MGRPPTIDRDSVLSAGLAIADESGLQAVTMQSVAERLGVTPMALYRHVDNKADLLDGLVELLLAEVATMPSGLAWQERLRRLGRAVRKTAQRHPGVFPLLLQRPAATAGALTVRDEVCRALEEGGIAKTDVARTERVISTAMLGFAASEAGGRFASRSTREVNADFSATEAMVEGYLEHLATAAAKRARTGGRPAPS
jgi:AcrR family transcriptional regulator